MLPPPAEPAVFPAQPDAPTGGQAQGYPTPGYPVPTPTPESEVVSSRKVALLRVLDADLDAISERSEGRVLDGSLQIAVGGLFVGIGIVFDDELLRSIMLLSGSVSILHGVNRLALEPNASRVAIEYRHMPAITEAQVAAKLKFGEESLYRMASRMRAARLADGLVTMIGAAGYVPLYWAMRHHNDPRYEFGDDGFDYVGLALSAIGFTAGLITVIRKSDTERRARAYRELKQRFVSESPREFSFIPELHMTLTPRLLGARAAWTF